MTYSAAFENKPKKGSSIARAFEQNNALIVSIIVAFITVLYVANTATTTLNADIALLTQSHRVERQADQATFAQYIKADAAKQKKDLDHSRSLGAARGLDQEEASDNFEIFRQDTEKNFQAARESIKTTNVEVEQVKRVLSGLDNHVSSVEASTGSRLGDIEHTIAGTNGRVSANAASIGAVKSDMNTGFGGIEEFYKDIKAQTEWAVHGPGGCNDVFANGEAKHPWKLTRSFVHSRQKIELEQCKMICKTSDWGCKYVSFYGAGKGWCYGFQSCDSHTTGQGWGGYTTYARRGLKDKLNDYVE